MHTQCTRASQYNSTSPSPSTTTTTTTNNNNNNIICATSSYAPCSTSIGSMIVAADNVPGTVSDESATSMSIKVGWKPLRVA